MIIIFSLLATFAIAGTTVIAQKVEGVTVEAVKKASSPIEIATFKHNKKKYGVKCAGADKKLRCEIWSKKSNSVVIKSSNLKVCKFGDNAAIKSEAKGWSGNVILLPNVIKHKDQPVCGG